MNKHLEDQCVPVLIDPMKSDVHLKKNYITELQNLLYKKQIIFPAETLAA
jgi:hypothetical protein